MEKEYKIIINIRILEQSGQKKYGTFLYDARILAVINSYKYIGDIYVYIKCKQSMNTTRLIRWFNLRVNKLFMNTDHPTLSEGQRKLKYSLNSHTIKERKEIVTVEHLTLD